MRGKREKQRKLTESEQAYRGQDRQAKRTHRNRGRWQRYAVLVFRRARGQQVESKSKSRSRSRNRSRSSRRGGRTFSPSGRDLPSGLKCWMELLSVMSAGRGSGNVRIMCAKASKTMLNRSLLLPPTPPLPHPRCTHDTRACDRLD
jgi:hypothetical protein